MYIYIIAQITTPNKRERNRGEFFSHQEGGQNGQLPIDQPPRFRNSTNDSNTRGGKQAARVAPDLRRDVEGSRLSARDYAR